MVRCPPRGLNNGLPDAASAVDATGHDGLDKGANVLVLDSTLATMVDINETTPV